MRNTWLAVGILTLSVTGMAEPAGRDYGAIVTGLNAESRADRLDALRRAEKIGDLPEALVAPVLAFVKRELDVATAPTPSRAGASDDQPAILPLRGDEVSLAGLKDKPADFIARSFVLCGRLGTGNRYDSGYRGAAQTHFAFEFEPITAKAVVAQGDSARVYVPRRIGTGLAADVARVEEKHTRLAVRLTCTVHRSRLENGSPNILSAIEVVDWQYYDATRETWAPAAFEGMKRGMAAIKTADRGAVATLVEVVASNVELQSIAIDDVLRGSAFLTLLSLSQPARADAIERLRQALPTARQERARKWIAEVRNALETTIDKNAVEKKPQAKGDPSARAASALRIGTNLEKSGKTEAAIKQYRQVIDDYPGTLAAETAAARVRSLTGK